MRTFDIERVKGVICHPEILPLVCDGEPAFPVHDSIYYLMPEDGAGVVAFLPINSITWNPHIAILPEHRGRGTGLMTEALNWMFENTPCRKVVAYPPSYNLPMIRVFEKCGFSREGFSPRSFEFRGQVYDRVLMGRTA